MQESGIRFEEARLVESCISGDSKAQENLYKRYAKKMFAVCCRYSRDQDSAADILQDGFIRVFNALETFKKEGSLEGWIRRIVVNTALEYHRKQANTYSVNEQEDSLHLSSEPDVHGNLGAEELLKLVQALPDGYRNVFNLYAIEGYNHKEIGEMLQISEGTSKSQLARARYLLQQKIEILMEVNDHDTGKRPLR